MYACIELDKMSEIRIRELVKTLILINKSIKSNLNLHFYDSVDVYYNRLQFYLDY